MSEEHQNDRIVGIDLGTTNSLVAYMEGAEPVVIPGVDGSNLVPSIVALDVVDPSAESCSRNRDGRQFSPPRTHRKSRASDLLRKAPDGPRV